MVRRMDAHPVNFTFVLRFATDLMQLEVPVLHLDGCKCHVRIVFYNRFNVLGGARVASG